MEEVLVLGATGKIGRHVVAGLQPLGAPRALARSDESAERLRALGAHPVRADLADPDSLAPAFEGVTRVFLATPSGPGQSTLENNALDASRSARVERVVKLSTIMEETHPHVHPTHAEIAERLANEPFAATVLRSDSFMDNLVAAAPDLRAGRLVAPTGDARRAFVDGRDVAAVAVAALTSERPIAGPLEVTGSEALSWPELASRLSDALAWEIEHVNPSDEEWVRMMQARGLPSGVVEHLLEMQRAVRSVGPDVTVTTTILDITGAPPRSIEDFVRDVLAPALA